MWFSMDEMVGKGSDTVTLFRLLGGRNQSGMEATLDYWGNDVWQLTYRSHLGVGPGEAPPPPVKTSVSFTRGAWQLLVVSHSLPYIRRSQVRTCGSTSTTYLAQGEPNERIIRFKPKANGQSLGLRSTPGVVVVVVGRSR
jgi:hypothetical protein